MESNSIVRLASPLSRNEIRRDTYLLRAKLGMKDTPFFPIVHFLEHVLPVIDTSFDLDIVDDSEMPGIQAEYIPKMNIIRVRNSVYEAAADNHWWARCTLAHELGHYYYHDEKTVRYAKIAPFEKVPPDFDPERQANVFAVELLAPINLINGMNYLEISKKFGVSHTVARRQLCVLERVQKRQERKREKKKGRLSTGA